MEGKRSRRNSAGAGGTGRRQAAATAGARSKPHGFSFKREAEWMFLMNLAPFVIGVLIALVFWFTR